MCIHSTARPRNSYDVILPGGRTIWCCSGRSSVHPVGHTCGSWSMRSYAGDGRRSGRDPGRTGQPFDGTMCVRLPHTRRRRRRPINTYDNNNITIAAESATTTLLLCRTRCPCSQKKKKRVTFGLYERFAKIIYLILLARTGVFFSQIFIFFGLAAFSIRIITLIF